jgi:hypothetical protein
LGTLDIRVVYKLIIEGVRYLFLAFGLAIRPILLFYTCKGSLPPV